MAYDFLAVYIKKIMKANHSGKQPVPNQPERNIPVQPDKDNDPSKKKERNDPTRIREPKKTDPTRIDEPPDPKRREV